MDDFESSLRTGLTARAAGVEGADDWDDLARRMAAGHRRRQRVAGGVAALALVAGPALGFAVGRTVSTSDDGEVASGLDSRSTSPRPTIPRAQGGPALGDASIDGSGGSTGSGTDVVDQGVVYGYSWGFPLGHVFTRTTGAGVAIRTYAAEYEPYDDGDPFWDPPGWCFATGVIQADVSTDAIAGVASGSQFAETREGELSATLAVVGVDEDAPVWVVIVQAPPGADSVVATFPGGGRDSMSPADGTAVVAAPAASPVAADQVVAVQALAGGQVVASRDLTLESGWGGISEEQLQSGECVAPPPTLPPAGEQPADAEAARAAVLDAYDTALRGTNSSEVRASAVSDPTGMAEIFEELRTGQFGDQVVAATVVVHDLVFDTPDHAWVLYGIDINGSLSFDNRFGEAILVDGEWKVARTTICTDVALAGLTC